MKVCLLSLVHLVAILSTASSACVSESLTVDQKLDINFEANDHDGDQIVTTSDIVYDLDTNYDTNKDGKVTEEEWVKRWTCAFGDSKFFARYVWADISQGEDSIRGSQFNVEPLNTTGIPRDGFIAMNRARYTKFQTDNCVQRELTVDEKLQLIARDNDNDNNGVVTNSDIVHDLDNNYDQDSDGKVTKGEFVQRWVCAYGDSAAYADYVWGQLSQDAESIASSSFTGEPFSSGVPLEDFLANNRKRYEDFEEAQGSSLAVSLQTKQSFVCVLIVAVLHVVYVLAA
nr:hypothetical protein BaRGS_034179 [Batillaria attramentaria]